MRRTLEVVAFTFVLAIVAPGCSDGGSGGGGGDTPPVDPTADTCLPVISECSAPADCCGTCFYGFCMNSPAGGKCATSNDCIEPYLCVNEVCATASCRQDLDACTLDESCCVGNCRGNGTCGANRPPVANAGDDATVDRGVVVQLGGLTTDPDGGPLTFSWTLAAPGGSSATLTNASRANPYFVPDVIGSYTVSVTVSDGAYSSSDSSVFTAINSAPVAVAQTVTPTAPRNTLVQLDASPSRDVNGDPITFTWTLAGPAGSTATLSSVTDPKPTFTPDLLGDFVATVVVNDGALSSSASVTVNVVNTRPVARITSVTSVNAGEIVVASAETSTDLNGDPLTFTWTLVGGAPPTLTSTTGPTTSFTTAPDFTATYYLSVAVSDGIETATANWNIRPVAHLVKLTHDIVGAVYSRVTDQLITISSAPANALWILDTATEVERRVDLPAGPPLSVAVSADGLVAVVGRNGGITEVDLSSASVTTDCVTEWTDTTTATTYPYDAASVAIGPELSVGTKQNPRLTRFAYAAPGSAPNRGNYTLGLDLGTCVQSADWILGSNGIVSAALRPVDGSFYVRDDYYGSTFYIYPVPTGPLVTRITADPGYYGTGRGFWFTEDGNRFFVEAGDVYDSTPGASAYITKPLTRLGALGNPSYGDPPPQLVLHADHCAARQHVSIVPMNDPWYSETQADTVLKSYYAFNANLTTYPSAGATIPLTKVVVDGVQYTAHARYVFYRSDCNARYAVMQTVLGTGVTLFAIAPMGP